MEFYEVIYKRKPSLVKTFNIVFTDYGRKGYLSGDARMICVKGKVLEMHLHTDSIRIDGIEVFVFGRIVEIIRADSDLEYGPIWQCESRDY